MKGERRRKEQIKKQEEFRRKRRLVIKALLASGVLAAGGAVARKYLGIRPNNKEQLSNNSRFVEELKNRLDLLPGTTRDQIAADSATRMTDPTWNTNTTLGTYINSRGVPHTLTLNEIGQLGEIEQTYIQNDRIAVDQFLNLNYPSPQTPQTEAVALDIGGDRKTQTVVVYGNEQTIENVKSGASVLNRFVTETLGHLDIRDNVLHLNFLPRNQPVKYLDIGNTGYIPESSFVAHMHVAWEDESREQGPIRKLDTYLNLHSVHKENRLFAIPLEDDLRGLLVNEVDGLLGRTHHSFNTNTLDINEAHSTMMGWLAKFDPDTAGVVLADESYKPTVELLAGEMQRLAAEGEN